MPIEERRADVLRYCQWDTFKRLKGTTLAADTIVTLFAEPRNHHRSYADTSMYMAMQLPCPQHFNVTHTQVAYGSRNSPEDNAAFRDTAFYEFWIGNKLFDHGPMMRFTNEITSMSDFGRIAQEAAIATKEGAQLIGNHVEYRLQGEFIGHHILQGESFGVTIRVTEPITFKADFKYVHFLEGVLSRSIQ